MLSKVLSSAAEDPAAASVQPEVKPEVGEKGSKTLMSSSAPMTAVRKLVARPPLYKHRRPSQLVPRTIASTAGSSRAAMLSMIEREGPGETALHKATRLGYQVRMTHGENQR